MINYIEGLPCAGKSLLAKKLESIGEKVIHELGRVLSKNQFPGDGKTKDEISIIDNWFIEQESKRHNIINNSNKTFFDRSFFTHITYAYAYSKLTNLGSFKDTVNTYQKAVEKTVLDIPDNLIYIDIPSEISIERQNNKILDNPQKALASFWREKDFLEDLLFAYSALINNYSGNIINLDGLISTDQKLNELEKELLKNKHRKGSLDFKGYLDSLS